MTSRSETERWVLGNPNAASVTPHIAELTTYETVPSTSLARPTVSANAESRIGVFSRTTCDHTRAWIAGRPTSSPSSSTIAIGQRSARKSHFSWSRRPGQSSRQKSPNATCVARTVTGDAPRYNLVGDGWTARGLACARRWSRRKSSRGSRGCDSALAAGRQSLSKSFPIATAPEGCVGLAVGRACANTRESTTDKTSWGTRRLTGGVCAAAVSIWIARSKNTYACIPVDCGESDPLVLDFDHRDGVDKLGTIAFLRARGQRDELFGEIAKCEVRCSNCHQRRTAKQFGWAKLIAW